MKKLLLITTLLTGAISNFSHARNASVLICENDYGEEVEFLYDFSETNHSGHFGQKNPFLQDIYDDCTYTESLMKTPHSSYDTFLTKLKSAVTDDFKFMLLCMSHSVWSSTFIYAYEDEAGAIQSKKGYVLATADQSVGITGSPNCYDDY